MCNAVDYFLKREPNYFKDFFGCVDNLHIRGHKNCAESYDARKFDKLKGLNTEAAEQVNSILQRIKRQVAFMTQPHFMKLVSFFLSCINEEKNSNIKSKKTKPAFIERHQIMTENVNMLKTGLP